jgi:type VI secretion system protein ImpJ
MSTHNRVIWSEGLFIQPQHFQQQERYFERYVENRCHALTPYSWGFVDAQIDRGLLKIGKFALTRARAIFPDGTPVLLPDDDPVPASLEIEKNVRNEVVYLAVPLRRPNAPQIDRASRPDEPVRQSAHSIEAPNVTSLSGESAVLEVGALQTRLLLGSDSPGGFTRIPLARIVECRPDNEVVLDDGFIPTVLQVSAAAPLAAFLTELHGLMRQRGNALAERVVATARGTAAELADFLVLQLLNRHEPVVAHMAAAPVLHPESLYTFLVTVAGELATFFTRTQRAGTFAPYDHERLQETFTPVITTLRKLMAEGGRPVAIPIPIEPGKFNVSVATVGDRTLYGTAVFVLAARADMSTEEVRRRFPSQVKIGPVETISNLVNFALAGVPMHPMASAPRQIPFHAGAVYFELDQGDPLWANVKTSAGIAIYVGAEFKGLHMELWAIRTPGRTTDVD